MMKSKGRTGNPGERVVRVRRGGRRVPAVWMGLAVLVASVPFLQGCSTVNPAAEPGPWTWMAVSPGPVFTKAAEPDEANGIGSPDVLMENPGPRQTFVLYYAQGGSDTAGRIGRATSPDGVTWTRSGTVLGPSPGSGAFDDHFLDTPSIVKVGSLYYLYYFGDRDNTPDGGQIGLATSADGIHFTRPQANPVLPLGGPGAWDEYRVESPDVVFDGKLFVMFYTGVDASNVVRTGRATSADGIIWTKDPANPLFDKGPPGAWDSLTAYPSGYVLKDGVYEMYYISASAVTRTPSVGLATSLDGRTFTRYAGNPVVTPPLTRFAPDGPINPCVVFDGFHGVYLLWTETGVGFFLAQAPVRPL